MDDAIIENPTTDDAGEIVSVYERAFAGTGSDFNYSLEEMNELIKLYPSIQFIIKDNKKIVASVSTEVGTVPQIIPNKESDFYSAIRAVSNPVEDNTTEMEFLYVTMISVLPNYRGKGLSSVLFETCKNYVLKNNKAGILATAVTPNFAENNTMPYIEYLEKVSNGEIFDATLSTQIKNGFEVLGAYSDCFIYPLSKNSGALILWKNPDISSNLEFSGDGYTPI